MLSLFESGIYTIIISILGSCLWLLPNPISALLCFLSIVIAIVMFLMYLQIEFFAAIILLIYAGAIVVLLLFVVMFMNFEEKRNITQKKIVRPFILFNIISCSFILKILTQTISDPLTYFLTEHFYNVNYNKSVILENINLINLRLLHISVLEPLYTKNAIALILLGVALLLAMFGAIYLTSQSQRH